MTCPYCGGNNLKKNGFKQGIQQYQCKDCKKYFGSDTIIIEKEENIKCIYCGGHTNKSGKTKWGVQIYWCRECHKRFNENTMPQPPIKERCPYCGGELKYKGWSNNGHARRYLCKECGKGFSGDLSQLKVHVIEMPCPYCGSEDIKKGGHLKSGARRYVCNSCGKGYNENTVVQEVHRPDKCPKCGGTHINLCGHEKSGKQRYKCIDCKHRFVENPVLPSPKVWEHECPKCGHMKARKAGKSSGKQYYECLACGHKTLEGGLWVHIKPKEIDRLKELYSNGMLPGQIAETMGRSERTIRSQIRTYVTPEIKEKHDRAIDIKIRTLALNGYSLGKLCGRYNKTKEYIDTLLEEDYKRESITKQQKETIVKFGIGCSVPIDYLAQYVGCSENMCKTVIGDFTPKKVKYKRTDVEKKQDWMLLDSFIR